MPAKITKRVVDALAAEDRQDAWVWDTELKGFGVRARPNGPKAYVLEYRPGAGGRAVNKRRFTIGKHGSPWTPELARKEAERLLTVVRAGGDPAADKISRKAAPDVSQLATRFLKEHAEAKRKASTAKGYHRMVDLFIKPAMGTKKVVDVNRSDAMKLHSSLSKTPYQANRVLSLVSKMFAFADVAGERARGTNPVHGIERFPEKSRERILSANELGWLGEVMRDAEVATGQLESVHRQLSAARGRYCAARAVNDRRAGGQARRELEHWRSEWRKRTADTVPTQAIACIRLLLFTGARLSEILTLKWEWIDFQRGEARLPESKTGAKTIQLPVSALDVLAGLYRVAGNPYGLPGKKAAKHFVGVQRPWRAIRNAATVKQWRAAKGSPEGDIAEQLAKLLCREPTFAECQKAAKAARVALPVGLSNLRIHDLRHGFASIGVSGNLGLPIVGKLLGHTQAATTQRYAHLASDPLKAAAASIAGTIAGAMAGGGTAIEPPSPPIAPRGHS